MESPFLVEVWRERHSENVCSRAYSDAVVYTETAPNARYRDEVVFGYVPFDGDEVRYINETEDAVTLAIKSRNLEFWWVTTVRMLTVDKRQAEIVDEPAGVEDRRFLKIRRKHTKVAD